MNVSNAKAIRAAKNNRITTNEVIPTISKIKSLSIFLVRFALAQTLMKE
jgi:hypothetical protein